MTSEDFEETLTRLDPSPRPSLDPNQRQELALQARHPSGDELEPGEIFDETTQAYTDPGWVPATWVPPLTETDLDDLDGNHR